MSSIALESTLFEQRAALLAAVADPIRLRVLDLLGDGAQCVCEIQEVVDVAPNLLSYHLRVLREAGLVTATRRGRWVDYRLESDALRSLSASLPVPNEPGA